MPRPVVVRVGPAVVLQAGPAAVLQVGLVPDPPPVRDLRMAFAYVRLLAALVLAGTRALSCRSPRPWEGEMSRDGVPTLSARAPRPWDGVASNDRVIDLFARS